MTNKIYQDIEVSGKITADIVEIAGGGELRKKYARPYLGRDFRERGHIGNYEYQKPG